VERLKDEKMFSAACGNNSSTGNDRIARIGKEEKQILETIHVGDVPAREFYSVYFSQGAVRVLVNTPQASIVEFTP
jgi:hypothetical protein